MRTKVLHHVLLRPCERNWLGLLFAFVLVVAACGDSTTTTTADSPLVTQDTQPEVVVTQADVTQPDATVTVPPTTEAPMAREEDPLGETVIPPGGNIEIRALQSISGSVEQLGTDQVRGIELAIKDFGGEINGHPINLGTVEDDLCNAEGGTAGAQAIIAQPNVIGTVGTTCSGAGVPASQIISAAGQILISGSNTSPALTSDLEGNAGTAWQPGYFRTAHNDLFQGETAARFAFEELGLTKAAAIHDGDPYTEGLATAFTNAFVALGGELTTLTAVGKEDTDMTVVLTEVAAGAPEVIYFPIFQPAGDFIIQQVRGVPGLAGVVMFAADGLLGDDFMALPETAGMYFSGPDLRFGENAGLTGVSYNELVTAYEAAYGEKPPQVFHAHTYDATMLLLQAISDVSFVDDAGNTVIPRFALREALRGALDFPGVTGRLSCDEFGDCGAQAIAIVLHLDPTDVATGKANVVYSFAGRG